MGGDHATHDIGYKQWQRRECHQLAHRVPIVVAWTGDIKPQPLSSGYDGLEALFIRRVSKAPPNGCWLTILFCALRVTDGFIKSAVASQVD